MSARVHVSITGRVQGVGFRASTERQALLLGLTGWVRNTPGGAVEAEFEGPRADVERMLKWCEDGPALARVSHVAATWADEQAGYARFEVRG